MKRCQNCGEDNPNDAYFCDRCGSRFEEKPRRQPTINVHAPSVVLTSIPTGRAFRLNPDEDALIGRGDPSQELNPQVLLDDDSALQDGVSRLHAKIFCQSNEYYILDLNSTNSTYLNKMRLVPQERYKLSSGDEVQLGCYLLRVTFFD